MMEAIFKERNKASLIQVIKAILETSSHAPLGHPELIEERLRQIGILDAYRPKNKKGYPIAAKACPENTHITLTSKQASDLGINGTTISIKKLQALAGGELVSRNAETIKACALSLLHNGARSNSNSDQPSQAYLEAVNAYNYLEGWTALVRQANMQAIEKGSDFLKSLKGAGPTVLLADREYDALCTGNFLKIKDVPFYGDKQSDRAYFNACVADSHAQKSTYPFATLFDPEGAEAIEKILRQDPTANWLLNELKGQKIPILLHQYKVPKTKVINGSRTDGTYILHDFLEYIRIFLNALNYLDVAVVAAHEFRHAWQKRKMNSLYDTANAVELVVLEILHEADSEAVQDKVAWNLHRLTSQTGVTYDAHEKFQKKYAHYPRIWTEEKRIEMAMRDRFVDRVDHEFISLAYIKKVIQHCRDIGVSVPEKPDMIRRALENSPYLKESYLKKLSQMEGSRSYLQGEDIQHVIKLMTERLPTAIGNAHVEVSWSSPRP